MSPAGDWPARYTAVPATRRSTSIAIGGTRPSGSNPGSRHGQRDRSHRELAAHRLGDVGQLLACDAARSVVHVDRRDRLVEHVQVEVQVDAGRLRLERTHGVEQCVRRRHPLGPDLGDVAGGKPHLLRRLEVACPGQHHRRLRHRPCARHGGMQRLPGIAGEHRQPHPVEVAARIAVSGVLKSECASSQTTPGDGSRSPATTPTPMKQLPPSSTGNAPSARAADTRSATARIRSTTRPPRRTRCARTSRRTAPCRVGPSRPPMPAHPRRPRRAAAPRRGPVAQAAELVGNDDDAELRNRAADISERHAAGRLRP